MLVNAETGARSFSLPSDGWQIEFDTSLPHGSVEPPRVVAGTLTLPPHTLLVLSAAT